jgi:diguanylate cyclase (GGDEF)-like protein
MVIDLDFFKAVNDTFGHGAGDELLKSVVKEVQDTIRVEDLFARIGGEEFVLLTPATSFEDAAQLAECLRGRIEALRLAYEGQVVSTTVSIGVAEVTASDALDPDGFVAVADKHLYNAKKRGRNRVSCG